MKILVACEESQTITKALREQGHEAYSCDIIPCSGGHPEWHIQDDAIKVAYGQQWDMMIAHPPCTHITNSGVHWLHKETGRWFKMKKDAVFFRKLMKAPIERIAIENPIPHKYAVEIIGRKYDQLIQPYMFGHPESKATCFWLKNIPPLVETDNVKELWKTLPKKESQRIFYLSPGQNRAKLRSKTFKGIADAIATQWTVYN